jgi:tetratricopeptide (TPR) repeat protein
MNQGDLAMERNDVDGALGAYRAAETMFPDNLEMRYWHAVSLANMGRQDDARAIFAEVFRQDPNWRELTRRLPQAGLLEVSEKDLAILLSA